MRDAEPRAVLEESAGLRVIGQSAALQRSLQTAVRLADKDVTRRGQVPTVSVTDKLRERSL